MSTQQRTHHAVTLHTLLLLAPGLSSSARSQLAGTRILAASLPTTSLEGILSPRSICER